MAVFTTERIARKARKCSDCGKPIRPGERYRHTAIPPGGELGYEGWMRLASHLSGVDCDYELAAEPLPDAPDGPWEDQEIPLEPAPAGEKKE